MPRSSPEAPLPPPGGDPDVLFDEFVNNTRWLRRRERFYESALGPMKQPGVYHWEDGFDPHIDVYAFGPVPGRDHETLITGGMADRPMPGVEPGNGALRRVEVLLCLRHADDRHPLDWAAAILREIASIPFLYGSPLAEGRLIEGGRSIRDGSDLQHAVLKCPSEPDLAGFVVDGERVRFLEPWFVTQREFLIGMERGGIALLEHLEDRGVGRVLIPDRPCTA